MALGRELCTVYCRGGGVRCGRWEVVRAGGRWMGKGVEVLRAARKEVERRRGGRWRMMAGDVSYLTSDLSRVKGVKGCVAPFPPELGRTVE